MLAFSPFPLLTLSAPSLLACLAFPANQPINFDPLTFSLEFIIYRETKTLNY